MTGVQEIGGQSRPDSGPIAIESISAITLATHDMARSLRFYRALGFELRYGGENAGFTSLKVGSSYLNICDCAPEARIGWWGRVIIYVSDVDAFYERAVRNGLSPQFAPRDASWGERYFHITDPEGHELSFARPLDMEADDR
jgi:catechol 2,3-dioxygenase-like lactoylglutathione lyase family enzyme